MKKTLLSILAMCFAFAMPAQATEDYEGFAPVGYSIGSGSGEATLTLGLADNKVLMKRSAMHQLEAAELITDIKPPIFGEDENLFYTADIAGTNLPYEIGWQEASPIN